MIAARINMGDAVSFVHEGRLLDGKVGGLSYRHGELLSLGVDTPDGLYRKIVPAQVAGHRPAGEKGREG